MFSLYCWETNKRAGTELVGTRISLFWFRTQVSQWPLRPSLNSLCSSLPSTHCGPAPLTFLSLDHQTSIPQDLCMCSYLCLEYLSLTQYFLIVPQKHRPLLSTLFCLNLNFIWPAAFFSRCRYLSASAAAIEINKFNCVPIWQPSSKRSSFWASLEARS